MTDACTRQLADLAEVFVTDGERRAGADGFDRSRAARSIRVAHQHAWLRVVRTLLWSLGSHRQATRVPARASPSWRRARDQFHDASARNAGSYVGSAAD